MKFIFPDIETTGLPPKKADWKTDYPNFPRILSIAWILENLDGSIAKEVHYLIDQNGQSIPDEITKLTGITNKLIDGSPNKRQLSEVLPELATDALRSQYVVGHNIYFDTSILKANTIRIFGLTSPEIDLMDKALDKGKRIDTVWRTSKYFGGWVSLEVMHGKLFNEGFQAHNAAHDVRALRRCFHELRKREVITL